MTLNFSRKTFFLKIIVNYFGLELSYFGQIFYFKFSCGVLDIYR